MAEDSAPLPTPVGVLVMAYGTPASLDDLAGYYTHIRRGRPPTDDQLDDLRTRYLAIGGVSPLRERTEAQRAAMQRALDDSHGAGAFVTALGQKHAAPFIEDAVDALVTGGAGHVVGLVLAPHFSRGSVGQYHERAAEVCADRGVAYAPIDRWADEPAWLEFTAAAVREARADLPEKHHVVFTAHSLPERVLVDDPYPDELHASAAAVAGLLDLPRYGAWGIAWQSAGRTPDPWRGPDVLDVIRDLAETGKSDGVLVCAQGFTSDHLEVLYDLDIEARRVAEEAGLAFARTRSLNDDPTVMSALATRVATTAQHAWVRSSAHSAELRTQGLPGTEVGRSAGRVVVVGGGVAGLTAAYTLLRHAPDTELTLVDAAPRAGGKLLTSPVGDELDHPVTIDAGADAFLARVPEAVALVRDLGLDDQLVAPSNGSAFLWLDGELRRLPEGLLLGVPTDLASLESSGLLTDVGLARLREEADLTPDHLEEGDRSVGEIVRKRLGDEAFERLVAPLLGGVHAGDADRLSVAAGAPQIAAALRDHGALLAGAAAQREAARTAAGVGGMAPRTEAAPRDDLAAGGAPVFYGLTGGMQQLTDALLDAIVEAGATVRLGTSATGITAARLPGRARPLYTVQLDDPHGTSQLQADAVVVASPAAAASRILEGVAPPVAAELAAIRYASVAMITAVLPRGAIAHALDGSGFLTVPSGFDDADPDLLLTACSFASTKWGRFHDTDPDHVVLRASAGRAGDTRALELDDDALVARVLSDLQRTIGLDPMLDPANPDVAIRVTRWTNGLPQFTPGHLDRVAASDEWLAVNHPGIAVVGASRTGLGIPACIVRAEHEVHRLLAGAARS